MTHPFSITRAELLAIYPADRDPRFTPRAGDILHAPPGAEAVTVLSAEGGKLVLTDRGPFSIGAWRDHAKGWSIERRAEDLLTDELKRLHKGDVLEVAIS
jgi:hypothetical protein